MSTDYSVYVGPYFKCIPKRIPLKIAKYYCSSCSKEAKEKKNYCADCAGKICELLEVVKNKFEEIPNTWDVMEKINDRLTTIGNNDRENHFYQSNISPSIPNRITDICPKDFDLTEEISSKTISNEIEQLKNGHGKEFALLQYLYGAKNVSICWGIITCYY